MDTKSLGNRGEDFAVKHLKNKGFTLIERNFRKKFGEIDIIAKERNGTLVFIEVKTMALGGDIVPEDQYSASKRQKTEKICQAFANGNPGLIDDAMGWRMDLICIQVPGDALKADQTINNEREWLIIHYENV